MFKFMLEGNSLYKYNSIKFHIGEDDYGIGNEYNCKIKRDLVTVDIRFESCVKNWNHITIKLKEKIAPSTEIIIQLNNITVPIKQEGIYGEILID